MAKIESKREFPQKSASECFNTCLTLVDELGYTLFKKRDIANLIICNGTLEGEKIDISIIIPMTDPTNVCVNLSAQELNEEILQVESERVLAIISENLA